jgi:hypothetical protein
LLTPEGKASALDQQVSATVPLEMANHYGFSTQAASRQWQTHKGMQSSAADWQTLDAARSAGIIPEGMGNIEAAKSMFTANRSLGGGHGPVQLSTDHDGRLVFSNAQNMTGQGFVRQIQTGMDGAGVSTYTGGAGTLVTEGRNGEETVTSANVRNMDMNFARKQEERNLEKAAHSLASSENYSNMLSRLRQDSRTSTEARSFSEQLSNSEQEKWAQSVENGSAFSMVKDEKTRHTLEASGASGLNFGIVKAMGGYKLQGLGEEGEKLNFSLSAKEAQAFEENRQRVRAEALTESLQNTQSLSYADNLSKSIGASEAHSYLREAQRINTDSASYNNNMETAFIRDYAAFRYGSDNPENVQKAMTFLNGQAIGSQDDQQHLNDLANDFLSGRFGALGTTSAGVAIEQNVQTVQASREPLRHQAHSVAETAIDKTDDISEQSLTEPLHERVNGPNRHTVESKVEARYDFFEREKTGQGRIQTNVVGMAGEGIGKIDRAIGKIVGKPERPQRDVMDIGAPDQPGASQMEVVDTDQSPAPATFEEALRKEQENKE